MQQMHQEFNGRAFAGSVRAQEAEDLAPAHFKAQIIQCADRMFLPEATEKSLVRFSISRTGIIPAT